MYTYTYTETEKGTDIETDTYVGTEFFAHLGPSKPGERLRSELAVGTGGLRADPLLSELEILCLQPVRLLQSATMDLCIRNMTCLTNGAEIL